MNGKLLPMTMLALLMPGLFWSSAHAQVTWTGAGQCYSPRTWGGSTNWDGGVVPPAGEQLVFQICGDGQIDLNGSRAVGQMTFDHFTTTTISPGIPAGSILEANGPFDSPVYFLAAEGIRQTYSSDYFTAGPHIAASVLLTDGLKVSLAPNTSRSAMLFSGEIDFNNKSFTVTNSSPALDSVWITADNTSHASQVTVESQNVLCRGTAINLADEGRLGDSPIYLKGTNAALGLLRTNADGSYENSIHVRSGEPAGPVIYADRSYQQQVMPSSDDKGRTRYIKNVFLDNPNGDSAIAFGSNGLWLRTNNGCIISAEKLVLANTQGDKTVYVHNGNYTDGRAGHRYMGGVNDLNISMNEVRFTGDAGDVGLWDQSPDHNQKLIKRGRGVLVIDGNNSETSHGEKEIMEGVLRFESWSSIPAIEPIPALPQPVTVRLHPDAGFGLGWSGWPGGQWQLVVVGGRPAGQCGALDIDAAAWATNVPYGKDYGLRLGSSSRTGGRINNGMTVYPNVVAGEASRYYLGGGGGTLYIDTWLGDFGGYPEYGIGPTWLEMGTTGNLLPGRVVLNGPTSYFGPTMIRAGTLELANASAAYCTSELNVSTTCMAFDGSFYGLDPNSGGYTFSGPGQLLLHPGLVYGRTGGAGPFRPRLSGGAVGWTGDVTLGSRADVGAYGSTLLSMLYSGDCTGPTVETNLLHLGGEYSAGTMTLAPTFIIANNGPTPVALVKSGTGSRLDLTNCQQANTYTGGTAIIGGEVTVNSPSQVGTGPILIANGGRLHITASGEYANDLKVMSRGTPDAYGGALCNGSVIEVDENYTAVFTGLINANPAHDAQYSPITPLEKLGAGTLVLDYRVAGQPSQYPYNRSNHQNLWGLKLTEGLVSINQLCYDGTRNGGYIVALGGNLEVRPTPVPLDPNFDLTYGFGGFESFQGTQSRITVQDGALFRLNQMAVPINIMGTVIFDTPPGDIDPSDNLFHLRIGHDEGGIGYDARGTGTLDVRGGTVRLTTNVGNVRLLPQEAQFTLKLNGGRFNGMPYADIKGNLVINDLDPAGTPQIDGAVASDHWAGPLSPTEWTIRGTGLTSWRGTLEKVGDGQVTFARCPGSAVGVDPAGATLRITSGTVEAGGAADPFTDTLNPGRHVDVVNHGVFIVSSGTKEIGHLVGDDGLTTVAPGAALITHGGSPAIEQHTVTVLGQLTIAEYTGPQVGHDASRIETLVIDPDGRFNLKNNALVIGTGIEDTVRDLIVSGYDSGTWGGSGLRTDYTVPGHSVGLGYAAGNDPVLNPLGGQFYGQGFNADSVLVLSTYLGDSDLNGDIDVLDVTRWAVNFTGDLGGPPVPSKYWTQGDWDYDGDVDRDDFGQWVLNFDGNLTQLVVNAPGVPLGAVSILEAAGITVVPEPSTVAGLLSMGTLGLVAFFWRRQKLAHACHRRLG